MSATDKKRDPASRIRKSTMPAWPLKVIGDQLVPAEMPQPFVKRAERALMVQAALGEEEFNKTIQGIFAEWINHGNDAQAIGDKSASWSSLAPKNGLSEGVDSEVFKEAKATMNSRARTSPRTTPRARCLRSCSWRASS